jgi:hypothetical protein
MKYSVPEETILSAADICGPDSSFYLILEAGKKYRDAGLTPIYMFDNILGSIEITTEENHQKRMN